jgi:DNA-binding YbaB/EbfC family protein
MNPKMIKQIQAMQQEMIKRQKELDESIFYGASNGNLVRVECTGKREILSIDIADTLLEDNDKEMLSSLIIMAVNSCMKRIDEETKSMMSEFAGGSIPGLF